MIIYKIENKINGKVYIGQTVKPLHRRIKDHFGKHSDCNAISGAIKKYGVDAFSVEIIEQCNDIEELNKAEIENIKKYSSLCPNGYNLREGGDNYRLTDSQKNKISKTLKAKGICPPSRKGSMISEEHRKAISKASKRPRTREQIDKWKRNTIKTNNKKVTCVEDQLCFKSLSDAAKYYNFSVSSIWRVCSGQKTSFKNKTFKYIGV